MIRTRTLDNVVGMRPIDLGASHPCGYVTLARSLKAHEELKLMHDKEKALLARFKSAGTKLYDAISEINLECETQLRGMEDTKASDPNSTEGVGQEGSEA